MNARPVTVETLHDANNLTPISPSYLLTLKSNVVTLPPGEFSQPDLYSKKPGRRVQHNAEEFCNKWRKEFLQSLQPRQNGKSKHQILPLEIKVLLTDECQQNQRPMARIVNIETDEKKVVHTVTLPVVDRNMPGHIQVPCHPITKIVMLVGNDQIHSPTEGLKLNAQDESHLGGAT